MLSSRFFSLYVCLDAFFFYKYRSKNTDIENLVVSREVDRFCFNAM